jgi:hypothetical protein
VKIRLIIPAILFSFCSNAQIPFTYQQLLETTPEINFTDSLLIDAQSTQLPALDTFTVKKWFNAILPLSSKNRLKNRTYAPIGKITMQPNFDLFVLLEEKKRDDSTNVQVVYFFTLKKDGQFIAKLEAAVYGERKQSGYNITSLLCKDYKIVQDSRITVNDKSYTDMTYYKINGGGRFILYPKE